MSAMLWQSFWISFAISAAIMPGVIALAHRRGLVARPREDRWSTHFRGGYPLGGRRCH